jgi:O-antigen ligase
VALDRPLALLAALFIALCWLGLAWSISPARTAAGALQASLVMPAALAFLAAAHAFPPERAPRLATGMTAAFLAGMCLLLTDRLDHFALLRLLDGKSVWPTKYNRGIDYFTLILLPTLGFCAAGRRWRLAACLCLAATVTVAAGRNTTAQLALPAAALVGALGFFVPRATGALLAAATAAEAVALPFAMRVITLFRPQIAPHIKLSGVERLEIWDYLSAHVLQRPFLGWGLWSSRLLPATPTEMAHFIKAQGSGIYPHNQFLELWVETGLPGVLLGLGFALLVLRRAYRCDAALRPFAYAAFTMAMAVASSGFEITTDSWWAALAASGALFALFARALASGDSRISAEASPPAQPGPQGTTHLQAGAPAPRRNRQVWTPRAPGGR